MSEVGTVCGKGIVSRVGYGGVWERVKKKEERVKREGKGRLEDGMVWEREEEEGLEEKEMERRKGRIKDGIV